MTKTNILATFGAVSVVALSALVLACSTPTAVQVTPAMAIATKAAPAAVAEEAAAPEAAVVAEEAAAPEAAPAEAAAKPAEEPVKVAEGEAKVGGGDLVYTNEMLGNVTFSHKFHVTDKGLACDKCHTAVFEMKKGAAKMTMNDMYAGKFCGSCHKKDGASFDAQTNCQRCHKK